MKFSRLAIAISLTALWTTAVVAQQFGLQQPTSAQPSAFESYYAQEDSPSPSDAPVVESAGDCGCQNGCNGGCGRRLGRLFNDCDPIWCPEECGPNRFFDCYNNSNCRGITITGHIVASYTWNPDRPVDRFNGPVTFNDRSDEFQMNQLWITVEKALDGSGFGWELGGRMDFVYGTDHRFTTAAGLEDNWNNQRFYGIALPQIYAELGKGDLSIKLGHYFTVIGYEVVSAPDNFFVSHAYTFQYGEPFTHTGILASYKVDDNLTVIGGVDQGWDIWEDDNNRWSFLGGVNWTSTDERTTVAFVATLGDEFDSLGLGGDRNRTMYSLVFSRELTSRWTYVFQHDFGYQDTAPGGAAAFPGDAEWYGVNQYLFYKINCCWDAGLRFEWFRDDDGTRVSSLQAGNSILAPARFAGNFFEVALGANYKPGTNWIFRAEARWDWYDGPRTPAGARFPFDDGADRNQFLAAFDAIYLW